jgi:CRISPR/Cas system CMR subunit Cmr6 (Cas7 group RAMP superfamily)
VIENHIEDISKMASFDFVQWKWLQLRSLESAQTAEKENLELRRRLVELESSKTTEDAATKTAIRGFARYVGIWLKRMNQVSGDLY